VTKVFRLLARTACATAAAAALVTMTPATAAAQDPNPGALTFTGGVDFPSLYVFRGIVQEADPAFTMFPYGDLGIAIGKATINVGTWHSLQTGSSGSGGPSEKIHYEEDFYATLGLGLGKGYGLGTTYTAYTSPNFMFGTTHELAFKVSSPFKFAPYGLIAFELAGGADGGENEGTYLELGLAPGLPVSGKFSLSVPVKFGFSLSDYYELDGEDHKFGFFDIGVLATIPLSKVSSNYGTWNLHGGVDFYAFGDTTKYFNNDDSSKFVGSIGFGVSY